MFLERRCPSCLRRSRFVCGRCLTRFAPSGPVKLAGLDQVSSLFDYDESVGRAILAAKNQGRRDILRQFGRYLGSEVQKVMRIASAEGLNSLPAGDFEVVTWVPASPENRRLRGYDQGLLLARSVAHHSGVPVRRLLTRQGGQQKGRDRQQRMAGVELWPVGLVARSVLVVDDVVTTGASLRHSAEALQRGGARSVRAVTIASTGWSASSRE